MEVKMTVEMEEVVKNFDRLLSWEQRRDLIIKSKKEGAKELLKRARQYAPVRSGALKRSLRTQTTDKRRAFVVVAAGKARKHRGVQEDAYYAHMVERGHKTRGPRGTRGRGKGFVEGKFYLTRAAEETTDAVFKKFKDTFVAGVYAITKTRPR